MQEEPINDVFTLVDFAFFDNSSIMIDYLNTLKSAAYIEIRNDQKMNDLTACFHTIDEFNFKK
ncbi:hypothetical protein [Abyssogena phaseoliformis symbiont]|uniref:hypothetical protein n=1 Tax=Abyssogena phaseoliformis symbiont TaxID=596095 RepID=UPI0019153E40|nr:hypothetical protein [Abyssogena phaseoliformis symbiont]